MASFWQHSTVALQLARVDVGISISSSWTSLTALQSLALQECMVQPMVLQAVPQLRALRLESVEVLGGSRTCSSP
jgi:hypothetical protein